MKVYVEVSLVGDYVRMIGLMTEDKYTYIGLVKGDEFDTFKFYRGSTELIAKEITKIAMEIIEFLYWKKQGEKKAIEDIELTEKDFGMEIYCKRSKANLISKMFNGMYKNIHEFDDITDDDIFKVLSELEKR